MRRSNPSLIEARHLIAAPRPRWVLDTRVVELGQLRRHEEVDPMHLKDLTEEIAANGVLKLAIAVDAETNIILDGEHRVHALRMLGCARVPVVFVDYNAPEIIVQAWRQAEAYSKDDVRRAGFSQQKLPPTTTKHMIRVRHRLWHISAIEDRVNLPLAQLRGEKDAGR